MFERKMKTSQSLIETPLNLFLSLSLSLFLDFSAPLLLPRNSFFPWIEERALTELYLKIEGFKLQFLSVIL